MTTYLQTPCGHGPVEKLPPARSLAAQLRQLFKERRKDERALHKPGSFTFTTPAQGDGYDFAVSIQFVWCVTGRDRPEGLLARTIERHPDLRDRLMIKLRGVSRSFPPYETAEAEGRIAQAVAEVMDRTCFDYTTPAGPNGHVKAIEARTTVRPDDAVREAQQAAWDRRQSAENDHLLAERLVPQLLQRRELWQEFLESGQGHWTTPYAVALTQKPEEAARIVREMFDDRHRQARELAEELSDQSEEYGEVNAFELMTRNDTVLRRLMELMGIEQPAEPAVQPFGRELSNGERRR